MRAVALALALVGGVSASASAADPYLGVQAQANFPTNEGQDDAVEAGSEGVPGIGLVFGADVNAVIGLEAEVGWRRSRLHGCNPDRCDGFYSSDGRVDVWYGMANARLQAPTPYVQPYVMGGLGGGYEREDGRASDGTKLNEKGFEFAYQFGGGVRIPIQRATLDLGVRRFEAGDVQHLGAVLGLSYMFGT